MTHPLPQLAELRASLQQDCPDCHKPRELAQVCPRCHGAGKLPRCPGHKVRRFRNGEVEILFCEHLANHTGNHKNDRRRW